MRNERRIDKALKELRRQRSEDGMDSALNAFVFPKTTVPKHRWVLATGACAGVALAGIVCVILFTQKAEAYGLDDIQSAIQSAPAQHFRVYNPSAKLSKEKNPLTMEYWQEGVKRRYIFSDAGFERGYDGNYVWQIRTRAKVAVLSKEKPDGFGGGVSDLNKEIETWKLNKNWKISISREIKPYEGKSTLFVTVAGKAQSAGFKDFKQVHYCDPQTKLPFRSLYWWPRKGKLTLTGERLIDYPKDIPDSVFAFSPPQGYSVYDHAKALDQIRDGLSDKGQSQTVDGVTIKFLTAIQERNGCVTVLWAGGAMPHIDATFGAFDSKRSGYGVDLMYSYGSQKRPLDQNAYKPVTKKKEPIGSTPRTPLDLSVVAHYGTTPIYAMKVWTEYASPNLPRKLRIVIPVCTSGPSRTLRFGEKGIFVRNDSEQIGQAEFEVETIPIDRDFDVIRQFDTSKQLVTGALAVKSLNLDVARDKKLRYENISRANKELMNESFVIVGGNK